MESGHKLSRYKLRVEQRDSVASLTPREEKVVTGGRDVKIAVERDNRKGGRGLLSEPNIEANEEVVREVQRGNH